METIENVNKIRCKKNDMGKFDCEVSNPSGDMSYKVDNIIFRDKFSGETLMSTPTNISTIKPAGEESKVHYVKEDNKLVID